MDTIVVSVWEKMDVSFNKKAQSNSASEILVHF